VARLIAAYEDVKTERGVIDFEDALLLLAAMLAEDHGVAQTVRNQYRHFVVDEYQDVSPLQQYLLDQWLGGRHELCVVGDPAQTIYSFAGASPHHLLDFARTHPGARLVRLTRDYRSSPQVVTVANRLLVSARRPGDPPTLQLVAQRPSGPQVRFVAYDDDEAEAATVAARCARLVEAGTPAAQIAVLFRTNAQSEAFEDALARVGVGYQVRGGERFFARRDVRDAIVLLRGGARAADPEVPMPATVRDILTSVGWAPTPPAARGAARERWDAMNALVTLADDLAADPTRDQPTLRDLVAELDERASAQHAPTVDGVTLASLHAAKGLEWDAVFLVGLSEGLLPISLAETDAAVDEERRLLYVGVTRAREHLELSYARRRPGGSSTRRRSRFLGPLWPQAEGQERDEAAPRADPGLLTALRAWRADVAARDRVALSAVLGDGVLARIAAARPTTLARLGAVPGVGPVKLNRYGTALLQVVAGFRVEGGNSS
jgi:DNA helicase-2/ATP-dependent DNA helicase PcrA